MDLILTEKLENGLGKISLNRPQALNALNDTMIDQMLHTLQQWEKDDDVKLVLFDSTNDRAFCAGGDIKAFYIAKQNGENMDDAVKFFKQEYILDELIYKYSKPIIANLNGIVMGGGVGLTFGANYKIITETTKWAMPEMNIAFFPDVGAAYFLNQAPGAIGRYVALTSKTFMPSDVLYMNAANVFMKQADIRPFINELETTNWTNKEVKIHLEELFCKHRSEFNEVGELERNRERIDKHFRYNTVEEIFASLENDQSEFAKETLDIITKVSPVSLKVTLEQLIRGENESIGTCLEMDLVIARRFLHHNDFFEGVRSVLIDKDRNPTYEYKTLQSVSANLVQSFFE